MAVANNAAVLITLQILNAWQFAMVAGVGLTLFQRTIPRPGLASGLFANAARLGAIVSMAGRNHQRTRTERPHTSPPTPAAARTL